MSFISLLILSPSLDTGAATSAPLKSFIELTSLSFGTTTLIVYSLTAAVLFKLSNKLIAVLNCEYVKTSTIFINTNSIVVSTFTLLLITEYSPNISTNKVLIAII